MGCTGYPADSHNVIWLTASRDRPIERCPECGGVYKMEYVGPQDDGHHHHDNRESFPRRTWVIRLLTRQTPTLTVLTTTTATQRPWPTLSVPSTDRLDSEHYKKTCHHIHVICACRCGPIVTLYTRQKHPHSAHLTRQEQTSRVGTKCTRNQKCKMRKQILQARKLLARRRR